MSTPIPATDANLEQFVAALPPYTPALEHRIGVHTTLQPRIASHVATIRTWDLRKLPAAQSIQVTGAAADLEAACARLGSVLSLLLAQGFVAKTTPTTRLASKLVPGARVRLVEAKAREYAQLFSKEQLDALEVAPGAKSVTATHAKVIAGDGETVGCFKLCHLRPVRL